MKMIRITTLVLTGGVLATGLFAQTAPHSHDHSARTWETGIKQAPPTPGMMDDKMMAHCMEMMQKHSRMQGDFKAMDARLDSLVSKMTAAVGEDRQETMRAVVSELISQQRAQRDRMASLDAEMMLQMPMGQKPMSMKSMMKGMQSPPSRHETPGAHSKHHP